MRVRLRMIGRAKSRAKIPEQPISVLCYRRNWLTVRLAVGAVLFTENRY